MKNLTKPQVIRNCVRFKLVLMLTFLLNTGIICAQSIIPIPKVSEIIVKKIAGSDLLIPVEMDFVNTSSATSNTSVALQIDNTTAPVISRFDPGDIGGKLKVINGVQNLLVNANETKKAPNTFYLLIDKGLDVVFEKTVYLNIKGTNMQPGVIKVTIQADDKALSLTSYLKDKSRKTEKYKLGYVTKVESLNNILIVSGYKKMSAYDCTHHDIFVKRNIELKRGEVFAVNEWSWIKNAYHWQPLPISLTTIPFKIRPAVTVNGVLVNTVATSGITNIGFNLDLVKYQTDRYFSNGKKTTHRISFGLWAAPSVEELDSTATSGANGKLGKDKGKIDKSKQLFVSTGLTLSYSYNDISFVFVPFGWDFGTTPIGKSWIYNKQRWWGFGIAISPKIFATILNK